LKVPSPKLKKTWKQKKIIMATESTRLSSRAMNLKEQPYQPIAVRFTKQDGTKISYNIGCGLSLKDLALVLGCYVAFYSFLFVFCVILMKGVMDTSDNSTMLWTFNFIGTMFGAAVGIAVKIGTKAQEEKKVAEQQAEMKKMQQADHAVKQEMLP
jgi:hypothetical protein